MFTFVPIPAHYTCALRICGFTMSSHLLLFLRAQPAGLSYEPIHAGWSIFLTNCALNNPFRKLARNCQHPYFQCHAKLLATDLLWSYFVIFINLVMATLVLQVVQWSTLYNEVHFTMKYIVPSSTGQFTCQLLTCQLASWTCLIFTAN